jgi:hypothetical protein
LKVILWSSALLGAAALGAAVTLAVRPARVVTVVRTVTTKATVRAWKPEPRHPRAVIRTRVTPSKKPVVVRRRHHTARQPVPTGPIVTPSLYERTTSPPVLREQGCRAGRNRVHGIVILDFGMPAYRRRGYGTVSFAGRFASNTSITWALKAYAVGYSRCLPRGATTRVVLARGTSNYGIAVPSAFTAGREWARETHSVARFLRRHHLDSHVHAAAADDVEPAWDRGFKRTYDFFRGFRSAGRGLVLYDYGSLDGGIGSIWKVRQAYYVAGGMRYARPIPEIYNLRMAEQWAELSRLSVERYGRQLRFAGLMTQFHHRCRGCGFSGRVAHRALVRELAKSSRTRIARLESVTNILSAPRYDGTAG